MTALIVLAKAIGLVLAAWLAFVLLAGALGANFAADAAAAQCPGRPLTTCLLAII